jgi:hypothetical protein
VGLFRVFASTSKRCDLPTGVRHRSGTAAGAVGQAGSPMSLSFR